MATSPNTWLHHATQFGHYANANAWKPARTNQDRALLQAAQAQHHFARRVRDQKHAHSITDDDLATALNVTPDTIGRYLRGVTWLNLPTMHHIATTVGLDVEHTYSDSE